MDDIIKLAKIAEDEEEVSDPNFFIQKFNFKNSGSDKLDLALTLITRRWMEDNLKCVQQGKAPDAPLDPPTISSIMEKVAAKYNAGKPLIHSG